MLTQPMNWLCFDDASRFPEYEKNVVEVTNKFAASFLLESLSAADKIIREKQFDKAVHIVYILIYTARRIRFKV